MVRLVNRPHEEDDGCGWSRPTASHSGGPLIGRLRIPRDPFEGRGARRTQARIRVEGVTALGMAIGACGLTAAVWLRTLAPLADRLGLS